MNRNAIALIVTLILGILLAPLASDGQPPAKVPRIEFMAPVSRAPCHDNPFAQGLRELGYVEAQNILIEWRYAPVFAYGKFWGIADLLYEDENGRRVPTATGKIFEKLGIPIPLSDEGIGLLSEEKEKLSRLKAALASHYGPTLNLPGDLTFRELLKPGKLLHARFGHKPLTVQVVTTKDSFVATVTRVFVQEDDGAGCLDQVVLYAFDASGRKGVPLFAVPVSKKGNQPAKISFQAPLEPAKYGTPHSYVVTGNGFRGKIILELPGEWAQSYYLVVKNAQDQTTFSREFASAKELGGSELYLSPPILLSSSPFPLFVVYSMMGGGWTYGRHVFQLAPGGKLKAIASMEIDVRGIPCL